LWGVEEEEMGNHNLVDMGVEVVLAEGDTD
jgi:hypothetical protein